MINFNKIYEDLKQEYAYIVFPKLSEAFSVLLFVILTIIVLSVLIQVADGIIEYIFNYIMFSGGSK